MLLVVPPVSADFPRLHEIHKSSWNWLLAYLKINPIDDSLEFAVFAPSYVCFLEDQLVGFIEVRKQILKRLYVHPDYHRRGAGKALATTAKRVGAKSLWIDENNQLAQAMFRKAGYEFSDKREVGEIFTGSLRLEMVLSD